LTITFICLWLNDLPISRELDFHVRYCLFIWCIGNVELLDVFSPKMLLCYFIWQSECSIYRLHSPNINIYRTNTYVYLLGRWIITVKRVRSVSICTFRTTTWLSILALLHFVYAHITAVVVGFRSLFRIYIYNVSSNHPALSPTHWSRVLMPSGDLAQSTRRA
jgi:hypothetical protein